MRSSLHLLGAVLLAARCLGASWLEDFASKPQDRGWRVWGEESLFGWNIDEQNLDVTWDSSKTNSYWYRPLGTVLTKQDSFSLAFDLRLRDIAIGTDPAKPFTFELAVGLVGLREATDRGFFRGSGINASSGPKNLVEFDYFPDSGFGATVASTVVSTNNRITFGDNHPLELTPGDLYHVEMVYESAEQILRTTLRRNGQPYGLPPDNQIRELSLESFPDFRVDSVAICSYNDGRQTPPQFAGSLRAHGQVDEISMVLPEPPLSAIEGRFTDEGWQVRFVAQTNWLYGLDRSTNFQDWTSVEWRWGTGDGRLVLQDTNANPALPAYYRVRAERP
jgi:hypothetical protein